MKGITCHNRRLAQWRVKWLIVHSTSHQLLWCIDSFVLRNPSLRQAPKSYRPLYQSMKKLLTTFLTISLIVQLSHGQTLKNMFIELAEFGGLT